MAAHRLLIAVTSLVAEPRTPGVRASEVVAQGPWSTGFMMAAHGLTCPAAHEPSWTRDLTCVCSIGRWILTHQATKEVLEKKYLK